MSPGRRSRGMHFRRDAAPVWVTYRTGRTGTRPPEGGGDSRKGERRPPRRRKGGGDPEESIGQLVALGFDVAVFTPAPYQRHRL